VGVAFELFTANMDDLTVFEHKFDASRRIYCLSCYHICSEIANFILHNNYLIFTRTQQFGNFLNQISIR
jgi:hypothetical protein